jgi:hypothetical protein
MAAFSVCDKRVAMRKTHQTTNLSTAQRALIEPILLTERRRSAKALRWIAEAP